MLYYNWKIIERGNSMSKVRLRVYDRPQGVLFGSPPSERTFIKNVSVLHEY